MKIWCNGTFDILHRGHLEMLNYAASLGDLYVGVDSDERVTSLKGEGRPVNNLKDRMFFLSNLKCVKSVLSFDSDYELITLIEGISPSFIVLGSDYKEKDIIAPPWMRVIYYPRDEEVSTTNLIERIRVVG
jgi:rfaE bifunctional protein nucleotidyltransferase chain/domain